MDITYVKFYIKVKCEDFPKPWVSFTNTLEFYGEGQSALCPNPQLEPQPFFFCCFLYAQRMEAVFICGSHLLVSN
jgi:hypothetical protein